MERNRVIQPEEETDPFRRLLLLCGLPVAILHRHNPGKVVKFRGNVNWRRYSSGEEITSLKTDETGSVVNVPTENPDVWSWSAKLTNATYAVVLSQRPGYKNVLEVHIWGEPAIEPIAEIITDWISV